MLVIMILVVMLPFAGSNSFAGPPVNIKVDKHIWGGTGEITMKSEKPAYERSRTIEIFYDGTSYIDDSSTVRVYDSAGLLYDGKLDNPVVYALVNGKNGTIVAFTRCSGEGEGYEEWILSAVIVLK